MFQLQGLFQNSLIGKMEYPSTQVSPKAIIENVRKILMLHMIREIRETCTIVDHAMFDFKKIFNVLQSF